MNRPRLVLLCSLILAGAATRLVPHAWNFTAIGAICLFGGAYFRRWWLAFLVPLAAIALSEACPCVSALCVNAPTVMAFHA